MKWPAFFLALLAPLPLAAEPVLVGRFPAKVVPEQVSVLTLPGHGTVSDLAPEGRAKAGTVVAILNKARMEDEREEMELLLIRDRLARRDELRQLRQQREKLVFYLGLSESERKYAAAELPAEGPPPTADSLLDIDERIGLVQRELETMVQRKRNEFERNHEQQILRMPFDGRLQYNIALPRDRSQPFDVVGTVQSFATVCDDSSYYITLSIARSDLSLLPEEKFSVSIALPEGRRLVGSYSHRRVEQARGSDMLVYFFRLPAEDADTAYAMLGSSSTASLLYDCEGEVERLPKATLAAHPAAAECENWAELVEKACPGAVVVLVADRDIVIRRAATPAPQP